MTENTCCRYNKQYTAAALYLPLSDSYSKRVDEMAKTKEEKGLSIDDMHVEGLKVRECSVISMMIKTKRNTLVLGGVYLEPSFVKFGHIMKQNQRWYNGL